MPENETDVAAPVDATDVDATDVAAPPADEATTEQSAEQNTEEITYHAVEKDGHVTAIWEMQGPVHLRTIDPRSRQGQEILRLYTSEHHEEAPREAPAAS